MAVDYILIHQNEKSIVRNAKVMPGECYIPQHRVMIDVMYSGPERLEKKSTYICQSM